MELGDFLKERIWRSFNPEDDAMVYWRERILFTMLACGLVLCPLVLPPIIVLIIKERLWFLGGANASAFVGMVYLLFSRKASYRLRAGVTLLIVYGVSLGVLRNVGIVSGAPAWLFAFSVLAGVLLGLRAACVAIALNLATLSAFCYGTSHGIFGQQFQFFSTPEKALAALVSFAMVNIAAAISVAVMLRGLERETRRQKEVTDRLKREMEEHQRSETALKKSESMLKSTFLASPVGLAVVKERRFIAVNESFSRITGYGEDELLGRTSRMFYENDHEYARGGAELYTSGGHQAFVHIEMPAIRKDGTVRDIQLRAAHFSPLDPLAGSVAAIEDVTEKRRSEKALRESEEKFRTTFQGSPD
ncbi:MAG: PAS domain S-box protein, partial [Deltaproteobacteria bacterium]|nr:PAS domain S-box protein [Deltaproteobacteria bacterium]